MVMQRPLRVLIVDDEPLGRQRIEDLLRKNPSIEIAGAAADGTAAVQAIRSLRPDLVFLDVQMPGMSGLDVIRALGPEEMPATVLVTAYDKHALEAFELAAVDYVVKPFDDERLEQAIRRARRLVGANETQLLRGRLVELLRADRNGHGRIGWLERIAVETRGKVKYIQVRDIHYILASGPYAELFVADRKHLVRMSMNTLDEQLDPLRFMRIHRSAIVQLACIDVLHRAAGGNYAVELQSGIRLSVSRTRLEELERRLIATP